MFLNKNKALLMIIVDSNIQTIALKPGAGEFGRGVAPALPTAPFRRLVAPLSQCPANFRKNYSAEMCQFLSAIYLKAQFIAIEFSFA